jgi:uncharacterized phage protein gp47/JayE
MPWTTPTLDDLRSLNRDNITAKLRSGPMVPNSVLRVMADGNAGLGYLTLLYIDWLARQLMPDTAETEWLDRFGVIWLTNSDGSKGRKTATYASGVASVTGIAGTVLDNATIFTGTGIAGTVTLQTTAEITVGADATPVNFVALDAGETGLQVGESLSFSVAISGINNVAISSIVDGIDSEDDDLLRGRVLDRIQKPPMGGDADDYVAWAKQVPGVTRAWASPLEMGIGTVTIRFMMDDVRATDDPTTSGFPTADDIATVQAYLDSKRPVAVKDFFVVAPIPEPIDFSIANLVTDNAATRAAIYASVEAMILDRARPAMAVNGITQDAQTIHQEWVSAAILDALGVVSFTLTMADHVMPSNGHMGVIGTITYP